MLYIDKVKSATGLHCNTPALSNSLVPNKERHGSSCCGFSTSIALQHRPKQLEKLFLNKGVGQNLKHLVRICSLSSSKIQVVCHRPADKTERDA